MSGLEKFQASEAWRTNFKKFLFMERKPEIVQNTLKVTESQRYSLDIGEDLKNIIEQKRNQKKVQINLNTEIINISNNTTASFQQSNSNMSMNDGEEPMWQKTSDEGFESLEKMSQKTASDPTNTFFTYLNDDKEQTTTNNVLVWQKTSDESFEALEKMCDKTASDPNSTLFQYLHSDRREQVLAEVKKRSAGGDNLDNLDNEDYLLSKISNCTLLDDIEAPSRMWENTICGDTILQTSPVKIVGLLRPSTILEEAPDDSANSDISSQASFGTATKSVQSDVSSAYETADDYAIASNKCQLPELEVFDVDQMLLNALAKNEPKQGIEAAIIPSLESMETNFVEDVVSTNKCEEESICHTSEESFDLIDLEKTFRPLYSSMAEENKVNEDENIKGIKNELENETNQHNILDDSIIDLLSDDEYEIEDGQNIDSISCDMQQITQNYIKPKTSSKTNSININHDTYSFEECHENDKENVAEVNEPPENSMQFNDTMEEVEYMLKKGMEYMAAEAAARNTPGKATFGNQILETQPNSPLKHISSTNKAIPYTCTTPAKKTPLSKGHSSTSKRFDIDIRPFPKLDIFAKPAVHARTKELTVKQQKFSHIISPIGTYMKKTGQTPLMSSIRCKNKDYFNSTAIQELETESRLYHPEFTTNPNGSDSIGLPKLPGITSEVKRQLPKKAYISSELKHIVDERTPVTIPGTKQIQKYLENAMIPAVLRHEGKLKMPTEISNTLNSPTSSISEPASKLPLKVSDTNSKASTSTSHIPRRNNASLADLSVMSGDVSMYTIMDAQKF